jgi:sec-independent protein translocase protein TatC
VGPGLETKEKKILIPFVIGSICAMGSGIAVAYKLSIPMANEYLMQFNQTVGVNSWTLEGYINYTLILMLGHIIAFEIGWLVLLMVHFRWLSAEWMIAQRRYMIVAAFIIGAALTPPDVLTQLLIALPLILFYEAGIYYAKLLGKLSYPNIN